MSNERTCPKCGAPLADDWKHDACPACLMQAGLPTGATAADTRTQTFAPPPGASPTLDEVRALFPQFDILEQIGRGGMGVVYKARQPQLDRLVALKVLPVGLAATPGFAERFTREARALARLHHPNIVSVFDFGQTGGHFFFIMEYVDGANLRQMIAAKQITPESALAIVPKVCEALQFAHDEGILHRDIKPENILIDKKGRVKIADFGLAKLVGDDTVDHSLTGTNQIMGTPRYMAPEQFENTKTVDHRADIYSLGVVFYEMLTGEIPMGRFAPPSQKVQVDVRIDEVVLRSLEREPAQRYQHVSEVKTGVENVTQHGAMASPPAVQPPPIAGKAGDASVQSLEPRLSKCALGSVIWATLGSVASASFLIHLVSGLRQQMNFPDVFIVLCILVPALTVVGSMVLGGLAIAQIKRSGGKLYGLPIAAVSLLAHPIFALGTAVWWATHLVQIAIWTQTHALGPNDELLPVAAPGMTFWILNSILALAACFFAARFAWRKIAGVVPAAGASGGANFQSLDHRVSEAVTKGIPGWFNARAKWVQSLVQGLLMIVWLIGLFAFLSFSFRASSGPGQSEKVIAIGAPAPWLEIVNETISFKWLIHPLAPSVVLALLGAAAAFIYEKIRRSRPGFDAEKDRRAMRKAWIAFGVVAVLLAIAAALLFRPRPATARASSPAPSVAPEVVRQKPQVAFAVGATGPELTREAVRYLGIASRQADEVNAVLRRYADEARALKRRNTKIVKNEQGHVLVTISPYSTPCLALASNLVAELGGIVAQDLLPAVRAGALPREIFSDAGECLHEIELWKEGGNYQLRHRQRDWVAAPGMTRSDMSSSNSGPSADHTFRGEYLTYWTEE